MSDENKRTLNVYQKAAKIYLSNNIKHDEINPMKAKKKLENLQKFIRENLLELPRSAKVLEIGSGNGENAKYIQSLGFNVTASDVADDFLKEIKNKELHTIKFDALEDEFPTKYDAIFCWRVFVHFTTEDVLMVLKKAYNALENNGIFIFNAINRKIRNVSEEWVDFEGEYHMGIERYYHYYDQAELDDMISQTNFKIKKFHKEGGENNDKWLVYVLYKE